MTRVKICGIRSVEDAEASVYAGADAIGLIVNIRASPRRIPVELAREIARKLPPFVTSVMVMAPSSHEEVIDAALRVRPGVVQLHGEEPPEMLMKIRENLPGIRLIKTIHVGSGNEIETAWSYRGIADALLLDTMSPGKGGSGVAHDWSVSRQIVGSAKCPVILAGGLSPSNVRDAVMSVRPFAVDVSSGVERKGQKALCKDHELVKDFIAKARST